MSKWLCQQEIRDQLDQIEVEGWNGPTGRALLETVRKVIVKPQVDRFGLTGAVAAQAEATAWEEAWLALCRPSTRRSPNPGGMVWIAARRAIRTEMASRQFATSGRKCWDHLAEALAEPSAGAIGVISLDRALEAGLELSSEAADDLRSGALATVIDALVWHGWDRTEAEDVVLILADQVSVDRNSGAPQLPWRWVSMRLGVPEWRARRVAALLVGGNSWPGLLEIIIEMGEEVVLIPEIDAAIRATNSREMASTQAILSDWFQRNASLFKARVRAAKETPWTVADGIPSGTAQRSA